MAKKTKVYTLRIDGVDVAIKNVRELREELERIDDILGKSKEFGGKSFARAAQNVRQAEDSVKGFRKNIISTEGAIRVAFATTVSRATNAIISGFRDAAGSVTGFVKDSVKAFASFDKSISRLSALTGATETQIQQLRDQAQELGATTAFTARQAAEAQIFLAQAGFQVEEIYSALPGVLELAAAGQLDLAKAADIASNVLGGLQLPVEELGRVNDVLATTANRANVNVQQLGSAFKNVAPTVAQAGSSFEEASAAIGILGNVGIQGSRAGTQLSSVIRRLLVPGSKQAASTLEQLGIVTTDAEGKFVGLTSILQQFEKQNVSLQDQVTIFGAQTQRVFGALAGQGADSLRDLTAELENAGGAAAQVAAEQLNNLAGDFTRLDSATEGLKIAVGDLTSGPLRALLGTVTELVSIITSLIRGQELTKSQTEALGDALQLVVRVSAVLLGIYVAFNKQGRLFITNLFNQAKALTSVGGAARAASVAIRGIRAALIATGIGVLIVVIGELVNKLIELTTASDGATKAQDSLQKAALRVDKQGRKEINTLNRLFEVAKDVSKTTEERQDAIDKLNKEYGQYLPNQDIEVDNLQGIESAQKSANDALSQNIKLRRLQAQQDVIADQRAEIEAQIRLINTRGQALSDEFQGLSKGQKLLSGIRFALTAGFTGIISDVKELKGEAVDLSEQLNALNEAEKQIQKELNPLRADGVKTVKEQQQAEEDALKAEEQAQKEREDRYERLIAAAEEAEAQQVLATKKRLAQGVLDEEEAQSEIASIEKQGIERQIAINEQFAKSTTQLRIQLTDAIIKEQQRQTQRAQEIRETELEKIEEQFEDRLAIVAANEQQRINALNSSVQQGIMLTEQAELRKLQAAQDRIEAEIRLNKQAVEQGIKTQREGTKEQAALEQELFEVQLGISEARIDLQERVFAETQRLNEAQTDALELALEDTQSFERRAELVQQISNRQIAAIESRYAQEIAAAGENKRKVAALEQEKANELLRINRQTTQSLEEISQERLQNISEIYQQITGQFSQALTGLSDIANARTQAELQEVEGRLNALSERVEIANENINNSQSKIESLEENLRESQTTQRNNILQLIQAEQERQDQLEAGRDSTIRQQEKLDQQRKQLQKEQAQRQKQLRLFEAAINIPAAVLNALATGGPPLAAAAGVIGAAQLAAIQAQPLPEFNEGGFTGQGGTSQVAGVVHSGEYVAPRWQVDSPTYGPVIRDLENARMKGYQRGGIVANNTTLDTSTLENGTEVLIQEIRMLRDDLKTGIRPQVSVQDIQDATVRVTDTRRRAEL